MSNKQRRQSILGAQINSFVDIEEHEKSIVSMVEQRARQGEKLGTRMMIYREVDPVCSIICRPFDSPEDALLALSEIALFFPTVSKRTILVAFDSSITLAGTQEVVPSFSIIAFSQYGGMSIAYAYRFDGENFELIKGSDAAIEGPCFPPEKEEVLLFFNKLRKSAFPPSAIMRYLQSKGHTVNFADGWNLENIDARSGVHFI